MDINEIQSNIDQGLTQRQIAKNLGVSHTTLRYWLKKYNVKKSFNPFSGKSPEQITLLMGGNDISKETKVLYANFGFIFDKIEMEQAEIGFDFYDFARQRQLTLIEEAINGIIKTLESENPEPKIGEINNDNNV